MDGSDYQNIPSPSLPVRSPMGHVKAFLPNEQHTSVSTLQEYLSRDVISNNVVFFCKCRLRQACAASF